MLKNMEKNDFLQWEHSANDPLPHVFALRKRILVEKATNELLKAEENTPDRRERLFQDVEVWQVFPVNTFR